MVAFFETLCYNNQAVRPVGQAVKTLASHAENMGSIPVRVTNKKQEFVKTSSCFLFYTMRAKVVPKWVSKPSA